MWQLKALVLVVLTTAALGRNVDGSPLKRHAKMTSIWRQESGLGSFSDVGTAGGNSLVKPQVLECTQAGYFPQPGSCNAFYRCVDWMGMGKYFSVFKFNCPFGTVFDDDLDTCNHPGAVRNPPECAGAVAALPPPGQPGTSQGPSTTPGDDTEPCTGTLAPEPQPEATTLSSISTTTEVITPFTLGTSPATQTTTFAPGPWAPETTLAPGPLAPETTLSPGPSAEVTSLMPDSTEPETEGTTLVPGLPVDTTMVTPTSPEPTWPGITDDSISTPATVETTSAGTMWEVDPSSIYACPAPGYYPFEGDCIRFYKCVETDAGKLKGLLYKCPDGYGYSEAKKRCARLELLPPCLRQPQEPYQRFENATPIYPDDLIWFFNNKK